jgi:uncharacterized small protein (DUF1192 family)
MRDEDDKPRGTPARPLDLMSVGELEAEIVQHEARIAVLRAEISRKAKSRAAANALFGTPKD